MCIAQLHTELSSALLDPSDCVSWLEYRVVQACRCVGNGGLTLVRCRAWLQLEGLTFVVLDGFKG